MRNAVRTALISGVVLAVQLDMVVAQDRPPPGSVVAARPAWRYDPAQRCPGLEVSPKGYGAVVDFFVNASGQPSKAFISTSSQSESLDAAALACVGKLRFQPAVHLGDANPVDSWQRIALKAEDPPPQPPGAAPKPAAAAAPAAGTAVAAAAPAAVAATGAGVAAAGAGVAAAGAGAAVTAASASSRSGSVAQAPGRAVEVRACADAGGKAQEPTVIQSSGNAQLDQAALNIARSGAAYLRQAAEPDGKPGCMHLAVRFESP